MDKEDEEQKKYEIGFLTRAEQDREELVKILNNHKFLIINDGEFSRIKLAYQIMRENFAYFGYLYFSGNPENIKELKNELKTSPKILRHMIILRPVMIMENKENEIVSEEKTYIPVASAVQTFRPSPKTEVLSNEELEKKLEEILK